MLIWFFAASSASEERLVESVLIYVISPFSYNFCATTIVLFGEKLNLLEASCCKVLVVKGGAGELEVGLLSMSNIDQLFTLHSSVNFFEKFSSICITLSFFRPNSNFPKSSLLATGLLSYETS